MKTKETTTDSKNLRPEKLPHVEKPRSLRPLRSMIAVRSLKPKTTVASLQMKEESAAN